MQSDQKPGISRRDLGKVAAVSALAGVAIPYVHAAEDPTVRIALVGCGGRGTGAAGDALRARGVSPKLVAMADVFKDRLEQSHASLSTHDDLKSKIDVPKERQFIGFDAYKKAVDCLRPGDVVIFATPLAFRWVHFSYAIEKGVNVFMEKPLSSDGFASKKLLALNEQAIAKNLKVAVGLMSRHARHLEELYKRVMDGEIGDIVLMRGYRMAGIMGHYWSTPREKPYETDLEQQLRRFHSFLWAGGGAFSDYYIHIVDHSCWMKNAWPVKAQAVGGRHYKTTKDGKIYVDQNFDSYGVEYSFADGTKLIFNGRCMDGAKPIYESAIHGTKGYAIGSSSGDCGGPSAIYKGFGASKDNLSWKSTDHTSPYQNEWNDLMEAIVNNKPYNEVKRGVEASLVTSMGRMAAHTGQEITFDQMFNSDHIFAENVDKLDYNVAPPVVPDEKGMYPQPEPGRKTREY